MGRQHQGMERLGVRQVPEGSGEQGKIEETGCKIICGAPTALAVKRLMMMMMMMTIMILQSTVKGERRPGRQRKRWEDNMRKWTGLEFGKSQRAVENREKLRKLVAKSSVMPQRPSPLRDR